MKLNNLDNNLIAKSLKEVEDVQNVPSGYVEVQLSTKGKLGAPKVMHVRNFKVGELLELSLAGDQELPLRLLNTINNLIYEDIDASTFHESEIEELMLTLYASFYSGVIEDIAFPLEESDLKIIKERDAGLFKDIVDRKWIPRTNIVITQDVDTYDLPDNFNPNITITNKKTGFHVTFSYMRYSDRLVVKRWLDNYFSEEEQEFQDVIKGEQVSQERQEAYSNYISEKFRALSDMSRIVSIVDYNGMDVSAMSPSEKYDLMANDARIDYGMISKLIKRQEKTPYGIKPLVRMVNPITNEPCERRFSFRIPTILQTMQIFGANQYDDGYDDEDGNDMERDN